MVWKSNYSIIDTETTGFLSEPLSEVIEVALIALDKNDLSEVVKFESLIKPANIDLDKPIPEWARGAFDVHNIPVDELKKAPSAEEVCYKIIGIFKKLKKPILVGQNIDFDIRMLRRLFRSCDEDFDKYFFSPIIDLYSISYMFWHNDPDTPNLKLHTVAKKLNIKEGKSHRAMGDCETTVPAFMRYLNFMERQGSIISQVKIEDPRRMSGKYVCPECGCGLSIRTAKKGFNKNNKFYGCKGYPNCRFLCDLNDIETYERKEE